MKYVSVDDFYNFMKTNKNIDQTLYLDVRTPSEFRQNSIKFFENISLDNIDNHLKEIKKFNNIIILCETGNRSLEAYKKLKNHIDNISIIDGGIRAWRKSNFPINQSKSGSISIIRQIQIIVGGGTLSSVLLSIFYNKNFIWLAGFFGVGQLVAGLSNTCALAKILNKMPWNKCNPQIKQR